MSAMSCSEMIALKATVLPRLMSERRHVMVQVRSTEFMGTVWFANYMVKKVL